jgi:hypothetical protein
MTNLTPEIRNQLEQHLAGVEGGATGDLEDLSVLIPTKLPMLLADRGLSLEEFTSDSLHYKAIKDFLDEKYPQWKAIVIWEDNFHYTFMGYLEKVPPITPITIKAIRNTLQKAFPTTVMNGDPKMMWNRP